MPHRINVSTVQIVITNKYCIKERSWLNFKLITSHVLRDGRQLGVHFVLNSVNTYPTEETIWV